MRPLLRHAAGLARGIALLGLSLVSAGCTPFDALNATISSDGVAELRDISYGPLPRQKLDVYRPTDAVARPVVVFFYGGSWRNGRRQDYRFVGTALARRGVVAVVADYRVWPDVGFPDFLRDGAAATAFAHRSAASWGADPARLLLAGHSAGAHIAAMLALDPQWLAGAGMETGRIAGLIGLAGPYDFLPMTDAPVREVFGSAADDAASQPITFATAAAPPSLLLHGAADRTVLPRNSQNLAARITALGGTARATIYSGIGHAGIVTALTPPFAGRAPVLDGIIGFAETVPATR